MYNLPEGQFVKIIEGGVFGNSILSPSATERTNTLSRSVTISVLTSCKVSIVLNV